jgi:UDP-N-acetyl-D-glucosamine dehydrogenase
MKVAIIGQGYVGLPLAKAASSVGHEVIGFDIDSNLVNKLLLSEKKTKNYRPTQYEADIAGCDIYIIAVPTPLDELSKPDISFLKSAGELIARVASDGALVVNESTSYPGTLREIVAVTISDLNKSKLLYASAPERIDPANPIWNIKNTPRIVAGLTNEATKAALDFYTSFCDMVYEVSSPEVAEAAKLFENTFRQVNIALANEFAQMAEKFGISANEVISASATKSFGFMKFTPGLGVGGHCIPIDPVYLEQKAESLGAPTMFIKQASLINKQMPRYVISRLKKIVGEPLEGKKICIVGLSYKKDVTDIRQSPSIELWKELENQGCQVSFHDDLVGSFNSINSSNLSEHFFDLAVIAVRHSDLDINALIKSAKVLFDCTGSIEGISTF